MQANDAREVRRLFDLVCDLPLASRAERLRAEKASAEIVAAVMSLCAFDQHDPDALQAGIEEQLEALTETELDVGDRLGAWRLVRRIGTGGMGAVYLAERADGHFEQQAALKMIRGVAAAATLEHFTRERQILAALHHPAIARLVDGGSTPAGQPYLVMDYVEGMPIDAYCDNNQLDLDARLQLFLQVCDAVQFAHQQLIVHCDLKPANVLVSEDGRPVLLDFGIARALGRGASPIVAEGSYLTPGYASPEQFRGESLSTASDVFALGLILFELACGRPARRGAGDDAISRLTKALVKPSALAAEVSWKPQLAGDLDAIILRATAALPDRRYETALALAEDIRRHQAHRPVRARKPTVRYRVGRLLRRRWLSAAVGATAVCLVAAFTWRVAAERDRAIAAEHDARREASSAARTRDFLVSVFNVSNPRLGMGKDVLARDVLDEGATRIRDDLDLEPKTKAVLVDTLATAYRYIGIPRRSVDLLREAVPLYLDPAVDDPLAAAAALSQLSVAYANASYSTDDALDAANRALDLRQRHGAGPLALADSYNSLGIVLNTVGRAADAKPMLQRGLALRRAASKDADQIAASLHNLGQAESALGDFAGATKSFSEALALRESRGGKHRAAYQVTLASYGVMLGRAGRTTDALAILEQNLALVGDLYGEEADPAAVAHNELGSVLHDAGRFREAIAHYEQSLRINRAINGSESAIIAKPLNNIASAHEDMGEYDKAVALFRESLAIRTATLPSTDPMVTRAEHNLARALLHAGKLAEATPLLRNVLATYRSQYGETGPTTIKSRLLEIEAMVLGRDARQADELLSRLAVENIPLSKQQLVQVADLRGRLARLQKDPRAETASLKEAWDLQSRLSGSDHPYTVRRALAYALALANAGQREPARRIAITVAPLARSSLASDTTLQGQLDSLGVP